MTNEEILQLIPQQPPFRFIDDIRAIDNNSITASYTFKPDEFFYAGHFPSNPITPGVILLEMAAQAGVVAFGIYLANQTLPKGELAAITTLFTESSSEFTNQVKPGDTVITKANKVYFRRLKLKVNFELSLANGTPVCAGTLAGIGVKL